MHLEDIYQPYKKITINMHDELCLKAPCHPNPFSPSFETCWPWITRLIKHVYCMRAIWLYFFNLLTHVLTINQIHNAPSFKKQFIHACQSHQLAMEKIKIITHNTKKWNTHIEPYSCYNHHGSVLHINCVTIPLCMLL